MMNILGRNYLQILDNLISVTDKIYNLLDLFVINQNQIGI